MAMSCPGGQLTRGKMSVFDETMGSHQLLEINSKNFKSANCYHTPHYDVKIHENTL